MKIDRSKLKKSSSEVPADCKTLINVLTSTQSKADFLAQLQRIETWTYGKCELLHWIDVLDVCDDVLEAAAAPSENAVSNGWGLACDGGDDRLKELLLWTLHFTTLLIEHSFSRHLYSSMEHLTTLLSSSDLDVVLAVLNLLYMFSKRSQFISRLSVEKRQALLSRLTHLAASWGGKESGFGLAKCCTDQPIYAFPESATTLHFEFYSDPDAGPAVGSKVKPTVIHIEHVDQMNETPAALMDRLIDNYKVPDDKRMLLFTYLRLAASFSDYDKRLKCVQARLQALSVLMYSNQLADNIQSLLYSGLLEELVEVLEMQGDRLMEIKAAALKALTSIIHLDRNPNFPKLNTIIDVTGASSYHGFLPVLVRNCITSLTKDGSSSTQHFPQPLATALFSFLYHLASCGSGGEALVSCGMMESLLKVIQWPSTELDHITFVTRAVRVIDLITNLDMHSFQTHSGLSSFIARLELEVEHCRKQQPFQILVGPARRDSLAEALERQRAGGEAQSVAGQINTDGPEAMEVDQDNPVASMSEQQQQSAPIPQDFSAAKNGMTCLPQRAALLKSMLNFLKKAIGDHAFTDSIRHVMEGSLPNSLKHIISNAEYYGPSLFLLATDVVTAYVFQEPSLLSSLQDNGLTDVVLQALLVKDVPATREVLGSLPNVFSALCLNSRGLDAFVACKPFERLFKVLLSPDYLPAMRRRRSSDPMGDTASNLGSAMDELMRHQPSLKQAATSAIIKLLEEVCALGNDPKFVCWKTAAKQEQQTQPAREQPPNAETGSSDEEDEEEEEQSNQGADQQPAEQTSGATQMETRTTEKEPVPLVDYIHNVMKFVDAILSNNSTDDHCREFVNQKGLVPLMGILGLPNLPIDFPAHTACQSVAAVAKSVLNLAHEPRVLQQGLLHLDEVLRRLEPLHQPLENPGGSVLLHELVSAPVLSEATSNPRVTPLLHDMSAAHAYIQMFVHVCRTGQPDIRTISVNHWGSDLGLRVLRGLSQLYTSLVWESTVLLALCSEDTLPPGCEFGKADMEKLLPPSTTSAAAATSSSSSSNVPLDDKPENEETLSPSSGTSADSNSSVTMAVENLSTEPGDIIAMDVNPAEDKSKEIKPNPVLHYQIKQIKPLLSGSSRLGRALAELFALLVKLCVGSPLRQRRGQQIPPVPAMPSPSARSVAAALTKLLASGLSWEPPSTSPVPRFRLTFYICSVGFTTPMLFDERRYPFHLMMMKFMHSGGQKAFFDTFNWALSCGGKIPANEGLESLILPDGTGEFLDAWLALLEKMVNTKAVLESPHNMPTKSTGNFKPFDPIKYLIRTHSLAFEAMMKLWNKKPLKSYGQRMSESILQILCHILKGEKTIADAIAKEKPVSSSSSSLSHQQPSTSSTEQPSTSGAGTAGAAAAAGPPSNSLQDEQPSDDSARLAVLLAASMHGDMDAAIERALQDRVRTPDPPVPPPATAAASAQAEAASASATPAAPATDTPAEEGTSAPPPAAPEADQESVQRLMDMGFPRDRCIEAIRNTSTLDQATEYLLNNPIPPLRVSGGLVGVPLVTRAPAGGASSFSFGEQDELRRAIEMSLAEQTREDQGSEPSKAPKEEPESEDMLTDEDFTPLSKEVIDDFTNQALSGCLNLLDTLPDTIYRVCDLMLAVFQRNGTEFKENVLKSLVEEVHKSVVSLTQVLQNANTTESFVNGDNATRAAVRIHLFTLLFEDCKLLCAKIVEETKILTSMSQLLAVTHEHLKKLDEAMLKDTPKWMTPMLLFIDLHEKVILGMNRRNALSEVCSHLWKWFDLSTGKWCSYGPPNNKTIDDAFWEGEASVKITNGRRRYIIWFGSMMQASEETGNRRPVMISLTEKKKKKEDDGSQDMVTEPSSKASSEEPSTPEKVCKLPTGNGLAADERSSLLRSCVALINVPVDADALNAVLRLCLRFTQDFRYAIEFAQCGGIKMLLQLTQASSFSGFTSLATLLIRHILEDPQTLRHTMEKVIRASTINSSSYTTKELNYLLRILAPAACRSPSVFGEVAREVLRVDVSLLKRGEPEDDHRLLVKSLPMKTSVPPSLSHDDMSNMVICDLLNFLVVSVPEETTTAPAAAASTSTTESADKQQKNELTFPSATLDEAFKSKKKDDKVVSFEDSEKAKKRPLLTKSSVCRLLAELVKSYGNCAKLITDHVYEAGISGLIKEETSALAFLLDELLICRSDKDSAQHVKTLVAALSSCNHYPDAQTALVSEVKNALGRALILPESQLKHTRVQALTGLICTMIESCPSQNQAQLGPYKSQSYNINNMVKMMLKKGLVTDLARVPHSLDLSSPNVSSTINAVLRPLETLSRIVNQPTAMGPGSSASRSKPKTSTEAGNATQEASGISGENAAGGGGNGTNTTNSEATRAQGDETVEPDAEATEHDVSTAAESMDPNSESQLQTVGDANDEEFEEMMDQLLERDATGTDQIIADCRCRDQMGPVVDSVVDDTQHDSQMLSQNESRFEAQQMSQDDEDRESESGRSDATAEENDDGMEEVADEEEVEEEEDDDDDDVEEEEDLDEDDEDDDDDEVSLFDEETVEMNGHIANDDPFYRYQLADNGGEIDFMIHYNDPDNLHAHMENTGGARAIHLPLWSDVNGTLNPADQLANVISAASNSNGNNHVSPSHPLLMGRQAAGNSSEPRTSERTVGGHRALLRNRGFRGYVNFNRGQNNSQAPQQILQNFLGQNPQELITQGLRNGTPVLVDFGFAILDSLDNDIPDIDTGAMGAGGRAALSTIPSALVRWNEESRVIDGDSMHDCVTALKPQIVEVVERVRDEELAERRAKKKKEDELKKKAEAEAAKAKQLADEAAAATGSAKDTPKTTQGESSSPVVQPMSNTAAMVADDLAAAISSRVTNFETLPTTASSTEEGQRSSPVETATPARQQADESRMEERPYSISRLYQQPFAAAETTSTSSQPSTNATGSSDGARRGNPFEAPASAQQPEGESQGQSNIFSRLCQESFSSEATAQATGQQQPPPTTEASGGTNFLDQWNILSVERFLSTPITTGTAATTSTVETTSVTGATPAATTAAAVSEAGRIFPRPPILTNTSTVTTTSGAVETTTTPSDPSPIFPNPLSPIFPNPLSPSSLASISNLEGASAMSAAAAAAAATPTEPPQASDDPQPGPSGTSQGGDDYSSILGMNISDLPEGVDPSFLAALPEDMRQEVIEEQRRLQNIRRRAEQNTEAGVTEVNPEFLAALPPNIQEEVLAQQRMEQQRQAASATNPEEPVDPGEFLGTLPAQLRQAVLADMEESQVPSLPAEYAAEAQNLRREMESRSRAMMQERFFNQYQQGSTLSSILRNTTGRNQHILGGLSRDTWRTHHFGRSSSQSLPHHAGSMLASATNNSLRFRGRQLLDHEGLSCLLILLFIDDSKINTTRLHRILKNLCYHAPTREWVVRSLLSILDRATNTKPMLDMATKTTETPPTKIRKSTSKSGNGNDSLGSGGKTVDKSSSQPSWLNISMDAALGFRANVFQINRQTGGGKKSNNSSGNNDKSAIAIHGGASAIVYRHTLEVLISLAKSFSTYFLPLKDPSQKDSVKKTTLQTSTPKPEKRFEISNDFWETLLRLDMQSTSKKGKGVARSHSSVSSLKVEDDEATTLSFEASPFGQLLAMLSSPVVRKSSLLTDKLLHLLSIVSVANTAAASIIAGAAGSPTSANAAPESKAQEPIPADHLKLAVEVLTSKSCSEEGLEDVTNLLSNLSYGPEATRDTILHLLLQGARELGDVVRQNILDLQAELQQLKKAAPSNDGDEESKDSEAMHQKGAVVDRFTKDKVILTAPSKVKGGSELQLPSMNALTNKTSSQAFFLRVLKVIIQLRDAALLSIKRAKQAKKTKEEEKKDEEEPMEVDGEPSAEDKESLDSLSEQLSLTFLWDTLSSCLRDLADTPDHHAVLVLQATVEAFFLVHAAPTQPDDKKKVQQKETRQEQLAHIQEQQETINGASENTEDTKPATDEPSTSGNSAAEELSQDTEKFLAFAEMHRTVLNQILRQSTTHLADGPFSVLVDHTRVLDFDIKRKYFRTELERMDEGMRREDLAVHVRRENVFEDSFRELHRRTPEEWKNRFYIVFEGEEGQDAGGLLREWYVIISREIFNPMYALFKVSPGDKVTYTIYEQSQTNPNHLDYFKFVGRVIAKAIYDNKLLECYFSRSFYKHILAKPVKYTDMESEDYAFYKGLEFLTQNKVEDLGYDLTFSTEIREFGVTEIRDMIPNGRNIPVTESNKIDYIRLVCQMKMTGAIRKQLSAFLEGFYNIIPRRLISIFNEQELELLLSGLPTIDIDDLKANTEYHKYQANSLQIVWFWRALRSFDQTDKAKFLQFVTGSSKVPLQGFSALEGMNGAQKFQIHKDDRSTDRLPSAHTCFNQLDLPAYETYDKLRTYLLKAIHECSEGFGFA